MEFSVLAHILFTIFCCCIIFFLGFICLKKKELVFLAILVFAIKSIIVFCIFQFPVLFTNNFFVDSKAYQYAAVKTSQYVQIKSAFPSNETYNIWDPQVSYVYTLIITPFYLCFQSVSTGFVLNAFFYLVFLLLFCKIFFDKGVTKHKDLVFITLLFWPSLFFNSILFVRDGLILFLMAIFFSCYERKVSVFSVLLIALCIFLEAMIRWYVGFSMLLFLIGNFILYIGRNNRKFLYSLSILFLLLIGILISYLGFTLGTIQGFRNILTGLEGSYNANSTYLRWFIIDSYWKLFTFIPLSVFCFLFSPLIPSDANPISLLACVENLVLLLMAVYMLWPNKKTVDYTLSKILKHSLIYSIPLLLVYSFGVADSGTAMRQKGFFIFVIVFAFYRKREWVLAK